MRNWIRNHSLITFFVLTYAITYAVDFSYMLLQPGQPLQPWSAVWFFQSFSPTISALLISFVIGGKKAVMSLLAGYIRWKVGLRWYFAAAFLFLGPLVIALVYGLLGNPVVGLLPGVTIQSLLGSVFFVVFSGPVAEEAGWRGFALPRLQSRHSALVSSLILGVIWTCWHIPLFFMTGATQMTIPFPIYLGLVTTLTVYFTWLYNNTHGSYIITILAHFCFNVTGTLLTGPLTLMPAMTFYLTAGPLLFLATVGMTIIFGAKYLSKKRLAELPFKTQ